MDTDEGQQPPSYIHASFDDVPLSMLLTSSRQSLETTLSIHFPHNEGTSKSVAMETIAFGSWSSNEHQLGGYLGATHCTVGPTNTLHGRPVG